MVSFRDLGKAIPRYNSEIIGIGETGMRLFIAALAVLWIFGGQINAQVHVSPFAGQWFPAEKAELEEALEKAFQIAEQRVADTYIRKPVLALVVPHAAVAYSGIVAASAYRLLDNPENVILLAFSHKRLFHGIVAPDIDSYATPLGRISVNRQVLEELGFPSVEEGELSDHSLEVQLPFLQHSAPGASITPLYVGDLSEKELVSVALKLADRVNKGDILIASSDFTHYGKAYGYEPYPNNAELPQRLFQQAMMAFEEIGSTDIEEFDSYLNATGDNICGVQPIRLLMEALANLEGNAYLELMDYMTSSDLSGDYSTSVGYGSLAFFPASAFRVGIADQQKLLNSARSTLIEHISNGGKVAVPVPLENRDNDLEQRSDVFVTLRKEGKLRGCMGTLNSSKPLWDAVADRTLAAATSDPRFPPLTAETNRSAWRSQF